MAINNYLNQLDQDREDLVDNLEAKGITGLTGDETFTELVPEVLNIPSGADLSDYFTNPFQYASVFGMDRIIKKFPENIQITFSNNDASYAFNNFSGLITAPSMDTSLCTNVSYMFKNCTSLQNVPIYNFQSATNLTDIYQTQVLTDESLNNILASCISATSYTGTKTLRTLFSTYISVSGYSIARLQTLSNYQDFIDAGWTVGW